MFLVEKANLSSHFRSTTKKASHVPKTYQLAARSFDEKVILHLKTLDLTSSSSNISLSWLSVAVSFLSTIHTEAEEQIIQISDLKSEADDYQALYMDYSMKVLDLCNLISSAVHRLTDRRLLMNFSLRLLKITDQMPPIEKLNKAKDAIARSVDNTEQPAKEKGLRAKALIGELAELIRNLPRGNASDRRDLIRHTFYTIGALTVIIGSILVNVLFGEMDRTGKLRVLAESLFSDSVNGVQPQIVDLIKPKQNTILDIDNVSRQAVVVGELLQVVISDAVGNADGRLQLEAGVKELASSLKEFSDGVDGLTNGVNVLFRTVLKTRNGRLDI
ncbi:hypothetical protein R6Q59_002518 [Mikania micrantha]